MSMRIVYSDMNRDHDATGRQEPAIPDDGSLIQGLLLATLIGAVVWGVGFWLLFG